MRNYLIVIFFIAMLLAFIIWMLDFGKRPDIYIDEIRKGYKGIIVEKLMNRTTILKIKTDNGEFVEVGILCNELKENAEIGDLIEKIPNENYVLLRKTNGTSKLPYIYISKQMRSDRRWPKEWKEKWLESTY